MKFVRLAFPPTEIGLKNGLPLFVSYEKRHSGAPFDIHEMDTLSRTHSARAEVGPMAQRTSPSRLARFIVELNIKSS